MRRVENMLMHMLTIIANVELENNTAFITVTSHTRFCCGGEAILNHCTIGDIAELADRLNALFDVQRIVFRSTEGWANPVDVTVDLERAKKNPYRLSDTPLALQFYGCQTAIIPGLIEVERIAADPKHS